MQAASLQGLKPKGFWKSGRRHKCLLHPVGDENWQKIECAADAVNIAGSAGEGACGPQVMVVRRLVLR
jgi:hypothetical protein